MKITKEWLEEMDACAGGYEWAVPVLGKAGMELPEFVKKFNRADWLVWTLNSAGVLTHQQNVLLACLYARSVLRHVQAGEDRPRLAIEAAEACARNPSAAASAVAWAASDAAWAVAWAASDAARAASAAASDAAWAASDAASAAARAASAAASAVAWAAARAASDAASDAACAASDAAWAAAWAASDAASAAARAAAHTSMVKATLKCLDDWGVFRKPAPPSPDEKPEQEKP